MIQNEREREKCYSSALNISFFRFLSLLLLGVFWILDTLFLFKSCLLLPVPFCITFPFVASFSPASLHPLWMFSKHFFVLSLFYKGFLACLVGVSVAQLWQQNVEYSLYSFLYFLFQGGWGSRHTTNESHVGGTLNCQWV